MSQILAKKLADEFIALTDIQCSYKFMNKGKNHNPTTLKKGQEQGVYVFLKNDNICFKVGKAGTNSQARWNSHHYRLNKTKSSLSGSIIKNIENFKSFFDSSIHYEIDTLNNTNMKNWIKDNISRIEFKISNKESIYALDLLEKYIAFKLKPIYEG